MTQGGLSKLILDGLKKRLKRDSEETQKRLRTGSEDPLKRLSRDSVETQ